ncbi:MAG: BMP family lipoprotein [Bdellovibrionota bacterium]
MNSKIRCFLISALVLTMSSSAWAAKEFRVGLVLDKGGKDDKSFNNAAYVGAMKAKDALKVYVKYVEATDDNAFESLIRAFAQKDFDLIIAIGVSQADAMKKVAAAYPNKNFAIIDAEVNLPNVRSMLFEEHEGSFLVGAIAGLVSKTGKVGFIGGMDIPLIRRFELGYEAGVKHVNPKAQVQSNYIGVTSEAWNNPAKAKELAVTQYDSGADIVFAAAGASNAGLFDAAEEKKKFAIGVDSNQNWIKPGRVLTSMVKHVDVAVYQAIEDGAHYTFKGGVKHYGLLNDGVDFAFDQYNKSLIPIEVLQKVEALKKQIAQEKLIVPDYYRKKH